jgi:predicted ATP-grasp superfamily ATP-dependent carboligase
VPLVADFFADQDTVALAPSTRRLASGMACGMVAEEVLGALEALARGRDPVGVLCGAGFEDRTDLVAEIARRWPLIGNAPEVIARVKDPVALAALCSDCGIAHPEISLIPPAHPDGWLRKRRGGAGGHHVSADLAAQPTAETYFQRRVRGASVSAAVLASRNRAIVLGLSAQWTAPTAHQPFRYGGAVTPAPISPALTARLHEIVHRVAAAVPLVGLTSIDFLVADDAVWLLEINPRPGATVDIFEPEEGSLFALHVDACRGMLPAAAPRRIGPAACATVYVAHDVPCVPDLAWPDWAGDRPRAGTAIKAGEPLCTVTAAGLTPEEARDLVAARVHAILSTLSEKAA